MALKQSRQPLQKRCPFWDSPYLKKDASCDEDCVPLILTARERYVTIGTNPAQRRACRLKPAYQADLGQLLASVSIGMKGELQ